MKVNLSNKVAIVTGAARGIGKACAQKLLENGAKVVIADLRKEEGQSTVKELSKFGPCSFVSVNITSEASIQRLVKGTLKQFGRIDILVNNAGVNVTGNPADRTDIDKFTTENWHKLIEVNLTGTFLCSRAVSRVMIQQKAGRIVNIGSTFGTVPARKQIAFVAAKAGVHNMTKAMALELAPHGINVNGVAPGSIPVTGALFTGKKAALSTFEGRMLSHVPLARFGTVEEVADSVVFLASEASTYITGHILAVDGGWVCGYTRDF
jgi:NAD(P)-dependent dehydrogenase (short-subunit alcohol dehydrogenase family)